MYADRLERTTNRPIINRLNGIVTKTASVRQRPVTGKRQRQDDKWEHDLYDSDGPQLSKSKAPKIDTRDLRLKLQKKSIPQATQNGSLPDLREKLSGTMHTRPVNSYPLKPKLENSKQAIKSVIGDTLLVGSRKVPSSIAKRKSRQKVDTTVDEFLHSLGLEKYQIQFQAEEVDMMALKHMKEEDFKAMGVPMGPRKKIMSALSLKS